jgi:hypothetical protein
VAPRVHAVVKWLAGHGASRHDIGRIVAELNDRWCTERCPSSSLACGRGPCVAASLQWLAAGSEGRREQTLKTDQDNGLSTRTPSAPGRARGRLFHRLASGMTQALVSLGFPPCEGGFMASNRAGASRVGLAELLRVLDGDAASRAALGAPASSSTCGRSAAPSSGSRSDASGSRIAHRHTPCS